MNEDSPDLNIPVDFDLESYRFSYPEELLAASPLDKRDDCRLLVLDRSLGTVFHEQFHSLPKHLKPGDCLVLNETRVFSCRLVGKKKSGGKAEILLTREISPGYWAALGSGFKKGHELIFTGNLTGQIEGLNEDGEYLIRFDREDIQSYMERNGLPPLPPYILKKRKFSPAFLAREARACEGISGKDFRHAPVAESSEKNDQESYQTVYARNLGSIAAPTAGLHFTPELLREIERQGVFICRLTLHVGRGTFKPIVSRDIRRHKMLPEYYHVNLENSRKLKEAQERGGKIIAVGTTVVRTLETLAKNQNRDGPISEMSGWTDLFVYPGYPLRMASALVTNFHLPESTPLILAAAFAGREKLLKIYQEAFLLKYRLFSYGDAMLIL